ncbi:MAG TPA: crotonase/enoyl-CoA hydratase family protein [Acidimicrobiales bacterium]
MSDRVVYTLDGGVADVRLNRPDKINAMDLAMFRALVEVGEEIKANPAVRAVVLSGEGRGFCAGLDFGIFQAIAGQDGAAVSGESAALAPPTGGRITNTGQQAVYGWTEMPAPVVAAVHGPALGAGCQLALGADIRIVAPDATLSVLEIRWGLTPDMTGTQMLPRLVGLDVAKELTFTGRTVSGEEAVRLGLATRVSETPRDDALSLAQEIAAKSPHAVRGAKHLLNLAGQVSLAEGFAEEFRTIAGLMGSANQLEAVTAYFEQRAPVFTD